MRIHSHLFSKLDFLDLSHNQMLALSSSNYNHLIIWALGHNDHIASSGLTTRIELISILLLESHANLT